MQLHIKLLPGRDDALIAAVQVIPPGKRAERIREVLTQGLVSGPDLAQAVHRLASAIEHIEHLPSGVVPREDSAPATLKPTLKQRMAEDPAFAGQVRKSLLGAWG